MRREHLLFGLICLVAAALDSAVFWSFPAIAFTFSAASIFILLLSFVMTFEQTMVFAVIQGVVVDLYSPALFGSFALYGVLLVIVITFLKKTWFKQTSMLTVTLLSSVSIGAAYIPVILLHTLATSISILDVNPFAVVTVVSLLLGVALQCLVIVLLLRTLSVFQKFVFI